MCYTGFSVVEAAAGTQDGQKALLSQFFEFPLSWGSRSVSNILQATGQAHGRRHLGAEVQEGLAQAGS